MRLRLEAVRYHYGAGADVLRGADLDIEVGEAVAVMGPSGTGKSTLLGLAGLLLAPTGGRVLLDGCEAPGGGPARRQLRGQAFAWVFQGMNVLPRRTVLDNAALGLLGHDTERTLADPAAMDALARVGLARCAWRQARTLSGGEIQRLCIARALLSGAPCILADEPTGNLDEGTSAEIVRLLVGARDEGTSLLVATHDRAVAGSCDRVVTIHDGHIERT